jgi:hypothetical protein
MLNIMKDKLLIIAFIVISVVGIMSCDVDFNPNDDWSETTIVYGVLDQDADTNFIRIQKCFVGEGNYIEFAKQKDSIYYKADELEVKMYAFYDWDSTGWNINKAKDSCTFIYTESYNKPEGGFYSEVAPIFFTTHKLNPIFNYYLIIRNLKTGNIVTSHTKLVADYKINDPSGTAFGFNYSQLYGQNIMTCKWTSMTESADGEIARLFQPCIRFNFMENDEPAYIDIEFSTKVNDYIVADKTLSYIIFGENVLSQIKSKIQKRGTATRSFRYDVPAFQLYVYGCAENLHNYIDNNTSIESLTERPVFTNINNGVGIFSSRRLHINRGYTSWSNALQTEIEGYDIGF